MSELTIHACAFNAPYVYSKRMVEQLIKALEARGLRLLPITRLEGIRDRADNLLTRIWDCCPPDQVAYLETEGFRPLEALGKNMLRHHFSALLSLHMEGIGQETIFIVIGGREYVPPAKDILESLAQGRTPELQKVGLHRWTRAFDTVARLGTIIGDGKL